MLPAHVRLAELYHLHKPGKLTMEHGPELLQCLQINERYCWDMMKLQQLSAFAMNVRDDEWFEELRIWIDALRITGRAPRSGGDKSNDFLLPLISQSDFTSVWEYENPHQFKVGFLLTKYYSSIDT
ncbi:MULTISPECIES: hypothetical protein [unclassified Paenibacillus]|uniref:DUF7667 family protein n=1 Tax=unclassified Paenibacillus TaxID=185978 RepID=UPI002475905A|nr:MULTISPECIES: hypothetical protein [unclassified Paenibacillus]MDH6429278.1 hypothetical protein [Paenibacillus sp. PastH-4]MDH6445485.1 hypothetical protein [Paenibacillus sp. PastF-4]MDH6529373.1 hypothetical protein [Paenibacillus sp. PastH-3]